jgi:hypothetical protein
MNLTAGELIKWDAIPERVRNGLKKGEERTT